MLPPDYHNSSREGENKNENEKDTDNDFENFESEVKSELAAKWLDDPSHQSYLKTFLLTLPADTNVFDSNNIISLRVVRNDKELKVSIDVMSLKEQTPEMIQYKNRDGSLQRGFLLLAYEFQTTAARSAKACSAKVYKLVDIGAVTPQTRMLSLASDSADELAKKNKSAANLTVMSLHHWLQ